VIHPHVLITPLVSDLFEINSYVVRMPDRLEAVVIDPGFESDKIGNFCKSQAIIIKALMCTHGHLDHIVGNQVLKEHFPEAPIVIGSAEADKLTDPVKNLSESFGFPMISPPADILVAAGDRFTAAGMTFYVVEIPGHSRGHVMYLWKEAPPWIAFCGDLIMRDTIGRYDLPDADFGQLIGSIRKKIFSLPPDTLLLSGHGPESTVEREIQFNPIVGGKNYRER
jgi:hydroxyacylglutathione hydrolase